jgi:hypothetical protein
MFYNATNILTDHYFKVFFYIGLGCVVLAWGAVFVEKKINKNVFVFNERVPGSKLSELPLLAKLVFIGGGLTLLFSLGAAGFKNPIIDLPQPYTESAFSQATQGDDLILKSVVPGLKEEFSMYVAALLIFFGLKQIVKNPKKWVFLMLIASFIVAGILTNGHRLAYGSDQSAYIGVFMFEWSVQFINFYTGCFLSWIPHIGHNAVIVLTFSVAISYGVIQLCIIPIHKKRKVVHYEKKDY